MSKHLYFHPESQSYFIEEEGYTGDGLTHDVTYEPSHVIAAARLGIGIYSELNKSQRQESKTMKTPFRIIGLNTLGALLADGMNDAGLPDGILQPSCLTCEHFNEAAELCTKYNARPPARVIAYACEAYEDNNPIPF